MVTIKDVAKKASVSIATVSAVINSNKFVSVELKQRVELAINELGYRPNRIGRGLKKKETYLIGVVVTEITNPFYPIMIKGIEDVAVANNYKLMLCTTDDNPHKEYELVQSMLEYGVDGVILATVDNESAKSLDFLKREKIPLMLINRAPNRFDGGFVRINSCKVGELATEFLIKSGHKDIVFIGGNRLNSSEREKGYKDTLIKYGLEVKENNIIRSNYDVESAYKDISQFVEKKKEIPTAIFAASDMIAFGAVKALLDHGYHIPKDVSIIGSDNISFSKDFRIPLTTVDAKGYEIGKIGCEKLITKLEGKDSNKMVSCLLEPEIVIRDSHRSL
ncbi:LacI family DNA-binding transcriptional regulator [Lentibacillus sp. N15]|uniref:LacI family DNA-binding transcriptional regulator n=1 Tax=Lentibacillus songyuanensis TaxID=3136161 RepID=UPI0031BB19F3